MQHAAITLGIEEKLPAGTADHMAGICAGFARTPRSSRTPSATAPFRRCTDRSRRRSTPRAFTPWNRCARTACGGSAGSTSVPHGDFDAHFRDSHVDGDGVETIVHEYTVEGSIDASTRTIATVAANVRVLPWQECPGAIGSATRIRGMTLSEMRDRVRGEFVGTSTCTHLNDTLRAIADLDALLDLRAGL